MRQNNGNSCVSIMLKIVLHVWNGFDLTSMLMGTSETYRKFCSNCEEVSNCCSQPVLGTMPLGNLILAGAIMFTGGSANQCLRMSNFCGINALSYQLTILFKVST